MAGNIQRLLDALVEAAKDYDSRTVQSLSGELVSAIREGIAAQPAGFVKELQEAVGQFDRPRAAELCEQLVSHLRTREEPYPLDPSKKMLSVLRRKRYFDLVTTVADALIQTGQDAPNVRRQYAQGLLDQGFLSAGQAVLVVLEKDCIAADNQKELAETRGLLGRAKKQMYMDAAAQEQPGAVVRSSLNEAIASYAGEYRESKSVWHGINTVALLERARRDHVSVDKSFPGAEEEAREILKAIAAKKGASLWDFATAGEACLAIQDYPQSLEWIVKYTQSEGADAFEFASTLRQFEEVWRLDGSDTDQAKILSVLRSALLRQEGGRVEIEAPRTALAEARAIESDAQFEQVLGVDRYKTFQWYRTGLDRAAGVAKVLDRNGNGHGTGFLLRAADVSERIAGDWVLVTNAHVISDDPVEQRGNPAALPPDEVRIRFEAGDRPGDELEVGDILFTSGRNALDCTIVALPSEVQLDDPFPIARRLPLLNKNQRVYVIGHPRGGGLSYSIDDNLLLDHDRPKVHYRAPTEGGSSGSPVFNQSWDLIALHHAGGRNMPRLKGQQGTYPANEGLAFQSILEAARAHLGG